MSANRSASSSKRAGRSGLSSSAPSRAASSSSASSRSNWPTSAAERSRTGRAARVACGASGCVAQARASTARARITGSVVASAASRRCDGAVASPIPCSALPSSKQHHRPVRRVGRFGERAPQERPRGVGGSARQRRSRRIARHRHDVSVAVGCGGEQVDRARSRAPGASATAACRRAACKSDCSECGTSS